MNRAPVMFQLVTDRAVAESEMICWQDRGKCN